MIDIDALTVITPPAIEPVDVVEMREYLRQSHSEEDQEILRMIAAARATVEEVVTRRLINTVLALPLAGFPTLIYLPLAPLVSVGSISYVDTDGATQTLDPSQYTIRLGDRAIIDRAYGVSWPATRSIPEAVTVTFTVGYGTTAISVPQGLRIAVKQAAAYLFEHREAEYRGGRDASRDLPHGTLRLLRRYRWSNY